MTDPRADVLTHAQKMWRAGLVVGSAGNLSRRIDAQHIAITPSQVAYEVLTIDDVVIVDLTTGEAVDSTRPPSYELPMHLAVYRSIAYAQAVVHTHAPFVTTLSVMRRALPPVIDEMLVYFGGTVEVAEYAFTGTEAVGLHVVRALGDRLGAILANHGNVTIGRDLAHALHLAAHMEAAAQVYVQALHLGTPIELPREAIAAGRRLFEERNPR